VWVLKLLGFFADDLFSAQNVRFVEMGRFRMAAWYFSPFPKEYYPDGSIDCVRTLLA
jgi:histone acetyltransferase MYST1